SLPKIISQVVILGSQILGKAFVEAYRQAARNARSGASQVGGSGERSSNSSIGEEGLGGSLITRKHRMTIEEACQILNVKNVSFQDGPNNPAVSKELSEMIRAYENLFKANQNTSKYLLSKVVRARDRISAEVELAQYKQQQQQQQQKPNEQQQS
ncbi:Pam16-domain-containing protein, partial [Phakopsora pachyrhizi]